MTGDPKVSVIVPVRNGERFLGDAIDSVLSQTVTPDEILILVDTHSTDRTMEVARSRAGVTVIEQEAIGVSPAWNQGIARARCDVLAFLSADDRWTSHKLERQLEVLRARPELLFVVARFRYFLHPGFQLRIGFNPALLNRDLDGRIPETLVAHRRAFETIGAFDPRLAVGEDVDWFARAADAHLPMALIEEVLLYKGLHDSNLSGNAATSTPVLMQLLKRSLERRRGQQADPVKEHDD